MKKVLYAIVDVESTGCDVMNDDIFDISIIFTDFNTYRDIFSSMIKIDEFKINEAIKTIGSIIHIDKQKILCAPCVVEVMSKMLSKLILFSNKYHLQMIAHGIKFDYSIIKNTLDRYDIKDNHLFSELFYDNKIDTISLCRQMYPQVKSHSLDSMASFLGLDKLLNQRQQEKHSSMLDCIILEEVLMKIIKQFPFIPQFT